MLCKGRGCGAFPEPVLSFIVALIPVCQASQYHPGDLPNRIGCWQAAASHYPQRAATCCDHSSLLSVTAVCWVVFETAREHKGEPKSN